MKKFDIKWFKDNIEDNPYISEILDNGDELKYGDNTDGYYINQISFNSPYSYYSEYDNSGNLKMKLTQFYNCYVGKQYGYSQNGDSLVVEDFDTPFKFSIEDLVKMVKKQYNIDINKKEQEISLYRFKEYKNIRKPFYELTLTDTNDPTKNNNIIIDGITGEILLSEQRDKHPDMFKYQQPIIEIYNEEVGKGISRNNKENKGFWSSLLD